MSPELIALVAEVERLSSLARELAALRAYLEAFAARNASDEMDALSEEDQDRIAAYVRVLTSPYADLVLALEHAP